MADAQTFLIDFTLGGVSGAVAKTLTAPIERIKLVIQTQDANPKIRGGEVPRHTGIVNCGSRILSEQGMKRFWDGNFTNCIRYFPTQAFNLAFKDTFKAMFPKYNPKREFAQFFGANIVSGGLAAAGSLCIVYPLDYSRTRLASDVGSGKKTFTGLGDCMRKTAAGPSGFMALYTGEDLNPRNRDIQDLCERSLSTERTPGRISGLTWDTLCSEPGQRRYKIEWEPPTAQPGAPVHKYLVAAFDPAYGKAEGSEGGEAVMHAPSPSSWPEGPADAEPWDGAMKTSQLPRLRHLFEPL